MRLKCAMGLLLVGISSFAVSLDSFAGQWIYDENKAGEPGVSSCWYSEDEGYPADEWRWIDGRCYYFNQNGWMLSNTTTPDGYKVDSSGAWVLDIMEAYPVKMSFNTLLFPFTEDGEDYCIQDKETIDRIVQMLGTLNLSAVQPGEDTLYYGSTNVLTLFYEDGTNQRISWLNPVLTTNYSSYWIKEGNTDLICGEIYKNWFQSYIDNGVYEVLPEGTVYNLRKNLENDVIVYFELRTDSGETYYIDCSDARTEDSTGRGWAVFFNGFKVRILYDAVEDGICHAKIILITGGDLI